MHPVVPLAFIDYDGGPNPEPLNTVTARNTRLLGRDMSVFLAGSTVIGATYAAEWEALGIVPHGYITATDTATIGSPHEWHLKMKGGVSVRVYGNRFALNLFDDRVIDALNAYAASLNRPIFWDNGAGKLENCDLPEGTELQGAPPLNTPEFREAWRDRLCRIGKPGDILNGGHEAWYPDGWYWEQPSTGESVDGLRMFEQWASDPWFCRGWDFAEWAVKQAGVMVPRLEDSRVTLESAVAYAVCMNAVCNPEARWHFGTYVREGWKHCDPMLWVEREPVYARVVQEQRWVPPNGAATGTTIKVRDTANGIVYRAYLRPDHWREYSDEWEGTPIGTGRIEHVGNGQHPLWGPGGHLDNVPMTVRNALTDVQGAIEDGYQSPDMTLLAQHLWDAEKVIAKLEAGNV